jgi:hypothetical protein
MWLAEGSEVVGSAPFKIGSSYAGIVPSAATHLILAFHDQYQWNNNYGSQNVEVIFDGAGRPMILCMPRNAYTSILRVWIY